MAVPYLTPDDLKGEPTLARLTTVDDDAIAGYVAEFEAVAEAYRGVAFTPRDQTDTFAASPPTATLTLTRPKVRAVTSATLNGAALQSTDYLVDRTAGLVLLGVPLPGGWPLASIEVAYSHGFDAPPPTLLRACRQYVRAVALRDQQAVERDVVAQGFEGGGYTRYATPGPNNPTGFIEVDRLLNSLPDYRVGAVA